jgi:hypothetical protein
MAPRLGVGGPDRRATRIIRPDGYQRRGPGPCEFSSLDVEGLHESGLRRSRRTGRSRDRDLRDWTRDFGYEPADHRAAARAGYDWLMSLDEARTVVPPDAALAATSR